MNGEMNGYRTAFMDGAKESRENTINEILEWIENDVESHTEKIGDRIVKSYPSCEMIVEHLKEMKNR